MSPFSRALVASAVLHVGAIVAFGLAPDVRPHEPERIEVQIVRLPRAGGEGASAEGAGSGAGSRPRAGGHAAEDGGAGVGTSLRADAAPDPIPGNSRRAVAVRPRPAPEQVAAEPRADTRSPDAAPAEPIAEPAITGAQPDPAPAITGETPAALAGLVATTVADDEGAMVAGAARGGPAANGMGAGSGGGYGADASSGSGAGAGAGLGDGSRGGSGSGDPRAALVAHLRGHTPRCYPRAARQRRTQGVADVAFCIDAAGAPTRVDLRRSSGSALLDDAAIDCVVRGSAPLPARDLCVSVPIDFRLR